MVARVIVEYNSDGCLVQAENYPGAFTRGKTPEEALAKMPAELEQYLRWTGGGPGPQAVQVVLRVECPLEVADADSEVIFAGETLPFSRQEYEELKGLALKAAADFQALYDSIPDKDRPRRPPRKTFYGQVPQSAKEMYEHTKNVNRYYFGEIGVEVGNGPDILTCRQEGFRRAEKIPGFLANPVKVGSFGESWSLKKVCRRFIWHDRIHGKALYKMAQELWGPEGSANPFCFSL